MTAGPLEGITTISVAPEYEAIQHLRQASHVLLDQTCTLLALDRADVRAALEYRLGRVHALEHTLHSCRAAGSRLPETYLEACHEEARYAIEDAHAVKVLTDTAAAGGVWIDLPEAKHMRLGPLYGHG